MDINNFTIPIYRINTILSLFQNMDASYSIKELAELMNVPINVIREDIYTIATIKITTLSYIRLIWRRMRTATMTIPTSQKN